MTSLVAERQAPRKAAVGACSTGKDRLKLCDTISVSSGDITMRVADCQQWQLRVLRLLRALTYALCALCSQMPVLGTLCEVPLMQTGS